MTTVALKGLAARKVRALLTALAIVLGVAMVSGSFVLTDTISKALDSIFTSSYRQTDAVVSGKQLVDYSTSGSTVPASLLPRVRALPSVAAAAGSILDLGGDVDQAQIIDRHGKAISSNGNPTFGFGVDPSQPRFNPLKLVSGSWAGPGQVVLDAETAKKHDFVVGDRVGVQADGPIRRYTVSGIAQFGDVDTLGGATFAIFDIPTAQRLMRKQGGFDAISVAAKAGVSQEQLVADLRSIAPPTAQVKSASEQAASDKKDIAGFISFIRGFLLAFGGIALFVGAFVIFNTLSITVAQRTRELATLRTLGASRRQVLRSVVLESLVIGALASVVGLLLGFGLARGLSAVFGAIGLALPEASPVYATHTFVVSLLLGVVITVLAGLAPALRATRVPPIAAVREGAVAQRSRRFGPLAGVALVGASLASLAYALLTGKLGSGSSLLALAAGALLLMVGVAAVAPALVGVLARLVGAPFRRAGGVAGRLASENTTRNPSRTAATAAALMIGLALVSFVAVLGEGVRGSLDRGYRKQVASDFVVTSQNGWSPFSIAAGAAVANAPGVDVATSIRSDRGLIGKAQVNVNSVDPRTIGGLYHFSWKAGSDAALSRLDGDGAVVKEAFADRHDLQTGDRFTLRSPGGRTTALRVAGIYQPPRVAELLGGVVISQEAFDRAFERPRNQYTLVEGTASLASLQRALAGYPDAKVATRDEFVKNQSSFIGTLLNLLYVLLALSVIVSLFGMINTLVLSVFERTRELGMLRAVGMTRRQARRMVRHESVMTALIGAALGLPLGIFLAAGVTHALGKYDVTFSVPVASLVAFTVVAVLCGILAAVAPARRASKLNVLAALQYE